VYENPGGPRLPCPCSWL